MEYIYILLAIVAILVIKSFYDAKNKRELLRYLVEQEWGKVPTEEYSDTKFAAIKAYYDKNKDNTKDVDQITWNDLDMDEIYMLINNTKCSIGSEYLYAMLRRLEFDLDELKKRNRLMELFTKDIELRKQLQMALREIGKVENISIYEYFNRTDDIAMENPFKHYICSIGLVAAVAMTFVNISIGVIMLIGFLVYNIITYYQSKAKIENYFNVFRYILKMVNSVDAFKEIHHEEVDPYLNTMRENSKAFQKFRRSSRAVLGNGSISGDLLSVLRDYEHMILHNDIIKFNVMLKEVRAHRAELMDLYQTIGYLDSLISIASFRVMLDNEYSIPELKNSTKPYMEIEEIYHPLIDHPVKNSIHQYRSALITGSNASGKSTFLKTVAINAILSQTIYTSLSSSYKASFFRVYSSMALQDNIFNNESYYIVEIKSLKRILDSVRKDQPILCFVDEILRGTNTLERIAASSEILCMLAKENVICMAATHDLELTHILENYYDNYHFQEEVLENDITFDYKIYQGRAVSKNAIKLLKIIGYNEKLIQAATNRANRFLETNQWEIFQENR